jgi:cation-transporting ATPase 13A1
MRVAIRSERVSHGTLHVARGRYERMDKVLPMVAYLLAVALSYHGVVESLHPPMPHPARLVGHTQHAWWTRDLSRLPCDYSEKAQARAQKEVERLDLLAEEAGEPHFYGKGPRTPAEACTEARMDSLTGPMVYGVVAICIHALTVLVCQWSTLAMARIRFRAARSVEEAEAVRVVPVEHAGSPELCPVFLDAATKTKAFMHQSRKYLWEPKAGDGGKEGSGQFVPLEYPVALPFSEYLAGRSSKGLSAEHAEAALAKWGKNDFEIPLPKFSELFQQHAVAPFFVFQMFCVLLWLLDEYWMTSVFTFFMLLMFESTVVKQRLRNLEFIRSMMPKPHEVRVLRQGAWTAVSSLQLVPGDLVSLARPAAGVEETVPCDALVLQGTCVVNEAMLTGESTPQIKEEALHRVATEVLDMDGQDRRHIVFAGTRIVQASSPGGGGGGGGRSRPPDGGCIAYVLRTGFETSQGGLLRTILFASEKLSANNAEALFFILFLLAFALAASYYVLEEGLKNPARSRYRLMLSCTYIITSVVPPELPMELALAVTTSLAALAKQQIFCTEPFRIPLAGKTDVCFFDKTGTLTSENLRVCGVAGLLPAGSSSSSSSSSSSAATPTITDADLVPEATAMVLGACHSLAMVEGELIGDPMEIATLRAAKWTFESDCCKGTYAGGPSAPLTLRIAHRFPFTSALKRSSTVAAVHANSSSSTPIRTVLLAKGAPETIGSLLVAQPAGYTETFKALSRSGFRVLALATRELSSDTSSPAFFSRERPRVELEADLTFAGFLVLSCPLKKESKRTIEQLQASSHRCVMITGDNALTACHVARTISMVKKGVVLVLEATPDGLQWQSTDENIVYAFDAAKLPALAASYDLCVVGSALARLPAPDLEALVPLITVFARCSPTQKEDVLSISKKQGSHTLMCGDGTNDVGALKKAGVGIALLNTAEGSPAQAAKAAPSSSSSSKQAVAPRAANATGAAPRTAAATLEEKLAQIQAEADEEEAANLPVKLGDASIAAPFTAKSPEPMAVVNVIRQGRCTLVATLQVYKILALNCLVSAYSMSVLTLDGVKLGDKQMTFAGIGLAAVFFFISRSTPVKTLSKERPAVTIFTPRVVLSVLGQFALHLFCLITVVDMAHKHQDGVKPDPDVPFQANLVNTVVFLMMQALQLSNIVVNYQGRPFMHSLTENRGLLLSVLFSLSLTLVCVFELVPPFNAYIQLVPLPEGAFKFQFINKLALSFFGAWIWDRFLKRGAGKK